MNMYYENMEITNEAFGILKTVIDTMEKKCEMIKSELNEAVTVKEQIEIVIKLKNELVRFKGNIQKTKPNFFDSQCYRRLRDILGATIFTILTPVTFGISLAGTVGCINMAVDEPSADIVKANAIKSIDAQVKNCDSIINHLKEIEDSAVKEGFIQDYKENMKHNKEMRKENKQVKKDYKYYKSLNKYNSNAFSKFNEINNDIRQVDLSKKYPMENKAIMNVATKLKKEFDDVLKGTGVAVTISKPEIYDDRYLCCFVTVDERDFVRAANDPHRDYFEDLNSAFNVFKRRTNLRNCVLERDMDSMTMSICVSFRVQDTTSPSVESFILFCDSMISED